MCTVTYVPTHDGFILSTNRDESPTRSQTPLVEEKIDGSIVVFPKDKKGGSWIFASDNGAVLCVLNGAFEKHSHRPPYRRSRGLIAREFYSHPSPKAFFRAIDLAGIEPFTMLMVHPDYRFEFRWDEQDKYIHSWQADEKKLWSSSTLYTSEWKERRRTWFENHYNPNANDLLTHLQKIHRSGDVGDPRQNYIMNREDQVCTVSITHVELNSGKLRMYYESLLHSHTEMREIDLV